MRVTLLLQTSNCEQSETKQDFPMDQDTPTEKKVTERYISPVTKVITMNAAHIICGSERQSMWDSTEMEEGDDNW